MSLIDRSKKEIMDAYRLLEAQNAVQAVELRRLRTEKEDRERRISTLVNTLDNLEQSIVR